MSENKGKFTFVNDTNDDDVPFVVKKNTKKPELIKLTEEEKRQMAIENLAKQKRKKRIRLLKATLGMIALSSALFLLIMEWQDDWSLMAISDGLSFVVVMIFFCGWALFVYNHNIFSPLVYGLKTFGLMVTGKRPKDDYYTFMKNIQDNQIPSFYIRMFMITAFILLIPAVYLLIQVMW